MINPEELADISDEAIESLLRFGENEGTTTVLKALAKSTKITVDFLKNLESDQWLRK